MLNVSTRQHEEEKTESRRGYDCQSQDEIQHYDDVAPRKPMLSDMQSQIQHIFEKWVETDWQDGSVTV